MWLHNNWWAGTKGGCDHTITNGRGLKGVWPHNNQWTGDKYLGVGQLVPGHGLRTCFSQRADAERAATADEQDSLPTTRCPEYRCQHTVWLLRSNEVLHDICGNAVFRPPSRQTPQKNQTSRALHKPNPPRPPPTHTGEDAVRRVLRSMAFTDWSPSCVPMAPSL